VIETYYQNLSVSDSFQKLNIVKTMPTDDR
jgi:hypothetical protein